MRVVVWTVVAIGFVLIAAMVLTYNPTDFQVPLTNGYSIVSVGKRTCYVMDGGNHGFDPDTHIVVGPNVTRACRDADTLFGVAQYDAQSDIHGKAKPGYFVLNMNTNTLNAGMAEDQFISLLGELRLVHPSRVSFSPPPPSK